MKPSEFEALLRHADMTVPEGAGPCLADIDPLEGEKLLSDAFLLEAGRRGGVSDEKLEALREALQTIEADPQLLRLSIALRDDAHRALIHQRACDFERPVPGCLSGLAKEAYALLFALACLEQGLKKLRQRGIPAEEYEEVCRRMADKQMRLYEKTGSTLIDDYPWDMNFYGCGIFFLDRFYFVPYKWTYPAVFRHKDNGKALALWPAGHKVRRDGQLDGVNGVHDKNAFTTTWTEDAGSITAYPVNPVGVIRQKAMTIRKDEWIPALSEGDMTLAAHIPGGEGYTPQRWKSSMEKAKAFFDRWFPEIPTEGFWSESWLYDPGLYRLLPGDGRIMSVQRQFYCYPTHEGEAMAKLEVFSDEDADLDKVEVKTSLQRKLRDSLLKGDHYHCSGMFVLHEDLPRFGDQPYQTGQDILDYLQP